MTNIYAKDAFDIVGGQQTTIQNNPWQVEIEIPNVQRGGGVIIGSKWILTAAHMVYGRGPNEIVVRVGATNLSAGTVLPVQRIISFPSYTSIRADDIALIELVSNLDINSSPSIKAIKCANMCNTPLTEIAPGRLAKQSGWGLTNISFATPSSTLKEVTLPIISTQTANSTMKPPQQGNPIVTASMIALFQDSQDFSDSGDSGGPLVIQINNVPILIGIISWKRETQNNNNRKVNVCTSVRNYAQWIYDNTGILSDSPYPIENEIISSIVSPICSSSIFGLVGAPTNISWSISPSGIVNYYPVWIPNLIQATRIGSNSATVNISASYPTCGVTVVRTKSIDIGSPQLNVVIDPLFNTEGYIRVIPKTSLTSYIWDATATNGISLFNGSSWGNFFNTGQTDNIYYSWTSWNPSGNVYVKATNACGISTGSVSFGSGLVANPTINASNFYSKNTAISIYPNPVSNQINVDNIADGDISITDLSGKTILKSNANGGKAVLDVQSIPNGMYVLIALNRDNKKVMQKIVIEK